MTIMRIFYQGKVMAEVSRFEDLKREYKRLQGIYPSVYLSAYAYGEYGKAWLHSGYWK